MAASEHVRHALHRHQIAIKRDKGAEVVLVAQEEHGVAVRNQQEQEKVEPDDEQHHRMMITCSLYLYSLHIKTNIICAELLYSRKVHFP